MSYTALSARGQALYRLLGLHPEPFTAELAVAVSTAVLDWPATDVPAVLTELVEARLLDPATDTATRSDHDRDGGRDADGDTPTDTGGRCAGRYAVPDMFRRHACQLAASLPDRQRDHALEAMAHHYLARCLAADLALRPTQRKLAPAYAAAPADLFGTVAAAMTWFRRDATAVRGVLRKLVDRDFDTDLAWSLAEPLWALLDHDGHHTQVVETQQRGAQAAHRRGHHYEALALIRKAQALRHLRRSDEARVWCTTALSLAETSRDWPAEATEWLTSVALEERGLAAAQIGSLAAARADLDRSLAIERRRAAAPTSSGYGLALRLCTIAGLAARGGHTTEAHHHLDQTEAIMRNLATTTGDTRGLGRVLHMRGRLHAQAQQWPQACRAYATAEPVLAGAGPARRLIELYVDYAHADRAQGDHQQARTHLVAARDLARRHGHHQQADRYDHQLAHPH